MAKKLKTETILLSAFVGVESVHSFSAFLPSVFTIQGLAVPQGQQDMIRKGYVPAVGFSLALGGIVSGLIKSWLPIGFSAGTSLFMLSIYEVAIRTAPQTTQLKPKEEASLEPVRLYQTNHDIIMVKV